MNATLTLNLFRPSILDPVDAGQQLRATRSTVRERATEPVAVPEPVGGTVQARDLRAVSSSGSTLDDVMVGVWEGLAAHRTVPCLLCGGAMAPRYGAAGHAPVGGRCRSCGTTVE